MQCEQFRLSVSGFEFSYKSCWYSCHLRIPFFLIFSFYRQKLKQKNNNNLMYCNLLNRWFYSDGYGPWQDSWLSSLSGKSAISPWLHLGCLCFQSKFPSTNIFQPINTFENLSECFLLTFIILGVQKYNSYQIYRPSANGHFFLIHFVAYLYGSILGLFCYWYRSSTS